MGSVGKGIALIILLVIIVLLLYCFVFGKCSKNPFGVVPPRPNTRAPTRRKQDDDNNNDDINITGSGNAGIGATGSSDVSLSPNIPQNNKEQKQQQGCGFWDLGCKLGEVWNNLTSGKTIFGSPTVIPGIRAPVMVVP